MVARVVEDQTVMLIFRLPKAEVRLGLEMVPRRRACRLCMIHGFSLGMAPA